MLISSLQQQVKKLLNDRRIPLRYMKNMVKEYYPPPKKHQMYEGYSHHHNTKECTSRVQL